MTQDTEPMGPDAWRLLLRKYINHVGECEGVDFLSDMYRDYGERAGMKFTDDEWRALLTESAATL